MSSQPYIATTLKRHKPHLDRSTEHQRATLLVRSRIVLVALHSNRCLQPRNLMPQRLDTLPSMLLQGGLLILDTYS